MRFFLGADLGATKTHTLIVDETGHALGFGVSGPANHETVGYDRMRDAMSEGIEKALRVARLHKPDLAGAGYGIAGYDWESQNNVIINIINSLGIGSPYKFVNDSLIGLEAGAHSGWGIVIVSGTSCNCRGVDRSHEREGRVTGFNLLMGEVAGATELVYRAMQLVGYAWDRRGSPTFLVDAFISYTNAKDFDDLIQGYTSNRYKIDSKAAPIIFRAAELGDDVARSLIEWAGSELGEMVNAVIRQLEFQDMKFDVVMTGGMFQGGSMLINPMKKKIHQIAPRAHLVHLSVPPVVGAVIIGMRVGGLEITSSIRSNLINSIKSLKYS